jgi:hypothetical protein
MVSNKPWSTTRRLKDNVDHKDNYFGFVTIPFMALLAFMMITAIITATKWTYVHQTDILATEH